MTSPCETCTQNCDGNRSVTKCREWQEWFTAVWQEIRVSLTAADARVKARKERKEREEARRAKFSALRARQHRRAEEIKQENKFKEDSYDKEKSEKADDGNETSEELCGSRGEGETPRDHGCVGGVRTD